MSYLSDQTPMVMYINAHVAIDQIRYRNQKADKIGAKVRQTGVKKGTGDLAILVSLSLLVPLSGSGGWCYGCWQEHNLQASLQLLHEDEQTTTALSCGPGCRTGLCVLREREEK